MDDALIDIDGIKLSVEEVAVLVFTNSPNDNAEGGVATLTTKEAYYWAVRLARLLQDARSNKVELSDDDVLAGLRYAVKRHVKEIRHYNETAFWFHDVSGVLTHAEIAELIENCFIDYFRVTHSVERDSLYLVREDHVMKWLIDKGLIEDPFFGMVGTILVAALGFIPHSFTQRTEKGEVVYRKIESLCCTYEMKAAKNESEDVNLCLKVYPLSKLIKGAFANILKDIVSGDGDGEGVS